MDIKQCKYMVNRLFTEPLLCKITEAILNIVVSGDTTISIDVLTCCRMMMVIFFNNETGIPSCKSVKKYINRFIFIHLIKYLQK